MSFISLIDKDGKIHWINPDYIEQVSDDPYREEGSKLYLLSGHCIEFKRESNEIADIIIATMKRNKESNGKADQINGHID